MPTMLGQLGDYWVIIAMVFIAFFRWLLFERGKSPEMEDEVEQVEPRPTSPPPVPGRGSEQSASDPGADLRRFLQELSGQAPTTPPPPVEAPPLPLLSEDVVPIDPYALEALEEENGHLAAAQRPNSARTQARSLSLRKMLSTPEALQQAVMLKEILDPPVSLRDKR